MVKRKKDKRTNNDLQNTTQKTKDRATRTPLKPGMNSGAPEGLTVPAPHVTPQLHATCCGYFESFFTTMMIQILQSVRRRLQFAHGEQSIYM